MLGLGIGSLIARWVFWPLLAYGWWSAELGDAARDRVRDPVGRRRWLGLSSVPGGALVFTAIVAMLDIALVLLIFKGDIKIS